jgi:ATP adenylyltransferase
MERLWAPWRLQYVQATDSSNEGCVFCLNPDPSSGPEDESRMVLHRGEHCFVILNIFPYNNGHLMIAPYRHTGDFCSLTRDEKLEIMDMLSSWTDILKRVMHCQGFNIGVNVGRVAGAGIADHIHFHVVPRWDGDTNFMPVVGAVKVMPQSLKDCYDTLKKEKRECFNEGAQGE